MFKKHQRLSILFVIVCVGMLLFIRDSYAALTVTIIVNPPGIAEVLAGSDPIGLAAQVSGTNLAYKWELDGPGKLEGDTERASVFYRPPNRIDGDSVKAKITVTVADDKGEETLVSETFTIIPSGILPSPISAPTPTPTPKPGMSKSTKVAIGVGAAVAVGGIIAILVSDSDDDSTQTSTVEITSHSDGSQVNMIEHVSGVARGFKSGDYVSIVVYSYGDGQSYPQTNIGIPDKNGNWIVLSCYFGREGDIDVGVSYEIQAYLKNTNHEEKAKDIVKVTRK